jgi:hypothetical protein
MIDPVAVAVTTYARDFFDLQLHFAETVSVLSGLPLARTVLEYTNFYIRFGLGAGFDPADPSWQAYVAGLQATSDRREWTYRFYLARPSASAWPPIVATFGCFSYGRPSGDRIRLHFQNAEPEGHSPLAADRQHQRMAELAALVEHVTRTAPEPLRVVGASWLYNLEAYRRLFPPAYLATAHVIRHRFQRMPLWGQFVNRHGGLREDRAHQFRERLGRQATMDDLDDCFPFQVLTLEASVVDFRECYGV